MNTVLSYSNPDPAGFDAGRVGAPGSSLQRVLRTRSRLRSSSSQPNADWVGMRRRARGTGEATDE
jgi:hypothetical protein